MFIRVWASSVYCSSSLLVRKISEVIDRFYNQTLMSYILVIFDYLENYGDIKYNFFAWLLELIAEYIVVLIVWVCMELLTNSMHENFNVVFLLGVDHTVQSLHLLLKNHSWISSGNHGCHHARQFNYKASLF